MPLPLIPLAVVGLGALAVKAKRARDASYAAQVHGVMTPARRTVYDTACNYEQDPNKLAALAGEFEAQGLKPFAEYMRKVASLRALPEHIKQQRQDVLTRALQSTDKQAVYDIAAVFHNEGCCSAAEELYKHGMSLP